jgi:hypothetical protein
MENQQQNQQPTEHITTRTVVIESKIEIVNVPAKPKRKYVKKSTMLLRSNNDYIDHDYWPRMYAKQKEINERLLKKYPRTTFIQEVVYFNGPVIVKRMTQEELLQQEIDNCTIFGTKCIKHNMIHKHHISVPIVHT